MKFSRNYFILFLLLFVAELGIALFLKGGFIRHTFGDFLIVILLYCFLKSIFKIKSNMAIVFVLLIAYAIEFLQFIRITDFLKINDSKALNLVLGNTFSLLDLLAYSVGALFLFFFETYLKKQVS